MKTTTLATSAADVVAPGGITHRRPARTILNARVSLRRRATKPRSISWSPLVFPGIEAGLLHDSLVTTRSPFSATRP